MVEFGSFVGYTATRMGRAVELCYEKGHHGTLRLFFFTLYDTVSLQLSRREGGSFLLFHTV